MACRKEYVPSQFQFIVGDPNSFVSPNILQTQVTLPQEGDFQLFINIAGGINSTVWSVIGGVVLPRDITDDSQISYGSIVNPTNIVVNIFNGAAGFRNGQIVIINFWYVKNIS